MVLRTWGQGGNVRLGAWRVLFVPEGRVNNGVEISLLLACMPAWNQHKYGIAFLPLGSVVSPFFVFALHFIQERTSILTNKP